MLRSKLLLICFVSLFSNILSAQNKMPSYLDVAREFFSRYSHQREEENDRIFFAKKREGWLVNIVDIANSDKVKKSMLFWDSRTSDYVTLTGFGEGLSSEDVDAKIDSALNGFDPPFLYGYQRCRYFGYDGWATDMIHDLGTGTPLDDTLVEGLGRAYGAYAEKFLWNDAGFGTYRSDTLVRKLARLEIPDAKRVDSFLYYINKSIDCYKELVKRNSGLRLLIGNSAMKQLNEQMHAYLQVAITGYKDKLKKIIAELPANDSVYEQIGRSYLSTCPPNSIIITYGDNDSYPLWYVQEKKNYRKDVTVLNYSLLGVAPYINMLKRENTVRFSSLPAFYGKENFDYFVYDESGPPNIIKTSLGNFLKDIQQRKFPSERGADTLPGYQVKNIELKVDLTNLKTMAPGMNLVPVFNIELSDYLLLNDLMVLDIVNSNIHSRPIFFTVQESIFPAKYLMQQGLLYQLLPYNEGLKGEKVKASVLKIENYLSKNPKPILAVYYEPFTYYENVSSRYAALFANLIDYYFTKKDLKKADEWASKYVAHFDPFNIRYTVFELSVAESLLRTSYRTKGITMIENIATNLVYAVKGPDMFSMFGGKEVYRNWLEYLNDTLRRHSLSSEVVDKLIGEDKKKE